MCTVVKLNSKVVKINSETKVEYIFVFSFNTKKIIKMSCIVAKCLKIVFHLDVDQTQLVIIMLNESLLPF